MPFTKYDWGDNLLIPENRSFYEIKCDGIKSLHEIHAKLGKKKITSQFFWRSFNIFWVGNTRQLENTETGQKQESRGNILQMSKKKKIDNGVAHTLE